MDNRQISRNFGFILKEVSRLYVARFERHASEISLTLGQCKALVTLDKNEGLSQIKLADLANVDPMTLVRILDHMELNGLLERRPDPTDRRARRLYLTAKARLMLREIWRIADVAREEVFAGIARKDRVTFIGVLEHMFQNLSALDADAAALPGLRERPRRSALRKADA